MKSNIIICAAILGTLAACNTDRKWEVKGQIKDAPETAILVQASENGRWYTLDTVFTGADGSFAYRHLPSGYPDIYRLNVGGKSVYFPIDSIETVTVTSTAEGFDTEYNISGSPAAEMLMNVDRRVREVAALPAADKAKNDSLLKRELAGMIISDPSGIVSYYIINKQLNGERLFDPTNSRDNRIIGAVANAFNENRPTDPRTGYLKRIYLDNRATSAPTDTIVARTMSYFDADLSDNTGKIHKLSDVVANNKVVLLNFTAYQAEGSPALNVILAEAYQKYHGKGLEIYQISLDPDEFQWRQSAKNLPWITVYNPPSTGASLLSQYNVTGLPTTFLFHDGELVERVTDMTKVNNEIARFL